MGSFFLAGFLSLPRKTKERRNNEQIQSTETGIRTDFFFLFLKKNHKTLLRKNLPDRARTHGCYLTYRLYRRPFFLTGFTRPGAHNFTQDKREFFSRVESYKRAPVGLFVSYLLSFPLSLSLSLFSTPFLPFCLGEGLKTNVLSCRI